MTLFNREKHQNQSKRKLKPYKEFLEKGKITPLNENHKNDPISSELSTTLYINTEEDIYPNMVNYNGIDYVKKESKTDLERFVELFNFVSEDYNKIYNDVEDPPYYELEFDGGDVCITLSFTKDGKYDGVSAGYYN